MRRRVLKAGRQLSKQHTFRDAMVRAVRLILMAMAMLCAGSARPHAGCLIAHIGLFVYVESRRNRIRFSADVSKGRGYDKLLWHGG